MGFKLFDLKKSIDKLKLSPQAKTWAIVILLSLIPVVWLASSEWKKHKSNEDVLNGLPNTLELIRKDISSVASNNRVFIQKNNTELINVMDKKFETLIDNIQVSNRELLKKAVLNQKSNQVIVYQSVEGGDGFGATQDTVSMIDSVTADSCK